MGRLVVVVLLLLQLLLVDVVVVVVTTSGTRGVGLGEGGVLYTMYLVHPFQPSPFSSFSGRYSAPLGLRKKCTSSGWASTSNVAPSFTYFFF